MEVGLCICFYDFLDVGDPYVYPAEGCCHQQVRFRLVVFRPFVGEVITAKVVSSTISGLRVSMGFFDDVIIPSHLLQQPSEYSESTGQWVWRYGEDEDAEFSICIGDEVRDKIFVF